MGVLVTVLVALPQVPAAYDRPVLRVVIDTAIALLAMVLAFLVQGRLTSHRKVCDLLLVYSLGLAGLVSAVFAVAPQVVEQGPRAWALLIWAPPVGRLLVAVAFVGAAWVPARLTVEARHPGRLVSLACVLTVLAVAVAVAAPSNLPSSAMPDLDPRMPSLRASTEQAVLGGLRLLTVLCMVAAAVGFARRRDDSLAPTLAASNVLWAFAALNLAVVPSLYPQWVYAGELLRIAAFGALAAAAAREVQRSWSDRAVASVQEERRRTARALHDGVAQEVNLVATQTRLWADGRPAMEPRLIAGAAERALDESRAAIHALTGSLDEPLHLALLRVADDLEGRLGVRVMTDVEPVRSVSRDERDAVVRAAREALVNAARHGGAERVVMSLHHHDRLRLVVQDDGCGYDVSHARAGFGLDAARTRLAAVHGQLRVSSEPGQGTTVEVEVP